MHLIRIERVILKNIGPFQELDLTFRTDPGINLICGDNGIGKTTILEVLAAGFAQAGLQRLKKKAGSDKGHILIDALIGRAKITTQTEVTSFKPEEKQIYQLLSHLSPNVINVRASRDFSYVKKDTISRDPTIDDNTSARRVGVGLDAGEIKQWFSNRFLMEPHSGMGGWTPAMKSNLRSAIELFSVLDPSVKLSSVDVRTFDIIVSTPSGDIPFEYLSSGFRSAYVLLLGILKEIEFRGLDVAAEDFSGVILIDELDLHLHPTWQRMIAGALVTAFPQAQIIATTHSPHVIQAAQATEVVALSRATNGHVERRELPSTRYGYAGWTLDEVLEDVMGVPDTKSKQYRDAVVEFDRAIADDDAEQLELSLQVLRDMLHPSNPYRKLIEIQAAPVIGNKE